MSIETEGMPSKGASLSSSGFIKDPFYDLRLIEEWCIKEPMNPLWATISLMHYDWRSPLS